MSGSDKDDEYKRGYEAGRDGTGGAYTAVKFVLGETETERAGRHQGEQDRAEFGSRIDGSWLSDSGNNNAHSEKASSALDEVNSSDFGATNSYSTHMQDGPNLGKLLFVGIAVSVIAIGFIVANLEPTPADSEAQRIADLSAWVYMADSLVVQHRDELRRGVINIAYVGARLDGEFLPSDQYRLEIVGSNGFVLICPEDYCGVPLGSHWEQSLKSGRYSVQATTRHGILDVKEFTIVP